jgi:hypothetical protein
MIRVARGNGLIALREVDWGTVAYWPHDPLIDRFLVVYHLVSRKNGGEPQMGRRLRGLFHDAGLRHIQISATDWCYATTDETRVWGETYAERFLTSSIGDKAVE